MQLVVSISDHTSGSDVYRVHIFTSSGAFDVSSVGNLPANVDFLVIAGGGGGGGSRDNYAGQGGGGAGGLITNVMEFQHHQVLQIQMFR